MSQRVIKQAVRLCGKSFISIMLDTVTNRHFYIVNRPDGLCLDFKRIDAAERFANYR